MAVRGDRRAGFTLIESLVALAITSAILVSIGALIHDSAFFFDRGTRSVDQTEQYALAIDCLTHDFAAARFVRQKEAKGPMTAFTGDGAAGKILFITGGGRESGPQGEEIVQYSVEREDDSSRLVRRRAPWPGPRMRLDEADLQDAVVLLSGPFDISFGFSELTPAGAVVWRDGWTGAEGLPHSVRLTLRDPTTGGDLLAGGDFPIRANAPMTCVSGKADCLSPANRAGGQQSPPAPQPSQADGR